MFFFRMLTGGVRKKKMCGEGGELYRIQQQHKILVMFTPHVSASCITTTTKVKAAKEWQKSPKGFRVLTSHEGVKMFETLKATRLISKDHIYSHKNGKQTIINRKSRCKVFLIGDLYWKFQHLFSGRLWPNHHLLIATTHGQRHSNDFTRRCVKSIG